MRENKILLITLLVLRNAGLLLGGENKETCTKNVITDNLEHVVTMSSGTMAQSIADAKHGVLLVYYYADWCNTCKIFTEKYAAAAAILARAGFDGVLARVLAEEQSVDQDIDKVPTLKAFTLKNDTISVYNGRLEVQPVVEFAARKLNFDPANLPSWGLHVSERRAQKLGWTKWINGEPPSFSGDAEMLTAIRNPDHVYWRSTKYYNICDGEDPINIQCRTISGVPWNETDQKFDVPCVPTKGLLCRHCRNNADCVGKPCRHCKSGCLDYEVRYKCCAQKCKRDSDCASFRPTCTNGCCKELSDVLAEPIVEDNIVERGVTNDGQHYTIEKM